MSKQLSLQCQRCRLPLIPHDSLVDLSNAQVNMLVPSRGNERSNNKDYRRQSNLLPPVTGDESNGVTNGSSHKPVTVQQPNLAPPVDSFVMLTESLMAGTVTLNRPNSSQNNNNNTTNSKGRDTAEVKQQQRPLSSALDNLETLFETLSANSDIDYPVCSDCAELIREGLKSKYEDSCNERDVYINFLNKLKDQPGAGSEEVDELMKEIGQLEKDNQAALEELKEAESERAQAERELNDLKLQSNELSKKEEQFYETQNQHALELMNHINERDRVESIYENYADQLERLAKVNVYNDVFCIGHDGHFGTINGLRLGRLRDKKVEWSEINAAWGQTLLLLATVVQKLDYKLDGYRLRPLGSASKIEKLEVDSRTGQTVKSVSLELYTNGDTFERLWSHKKLDQGMEAFLEVLKQVGEYVESLDYSLKLPYVIEGDKIGGCSIKLSSSSSQDAWTNACKYVLTNAKWILAYVSSR